jgi:isochorismate synthase
VCLEKNIPFVTFRLPNKTKIQTWIQLTGKFNFFEHIHEVENKTGFVYAPFHRKTNFPVVFFEPELIIENEDFEDSLIQDISAKPSMYPEYEIAEPFEIRKVDYLHQANSYIHSFDANFRKAILSRVQFEKKPTDFNIGEFFVNLQHTYPNAFCHLINIPGTGIWAGVSPEILIRLDKTEATTISLAGTQPNSNIEWGDKEIEEQKIVTDYIENTLNKFGINHFIKEKIQNYQAGNIVHLATKFNFNKHDLGDSLSEFISELHPTPAVCGLPKGKALKLILRTEKHNREYYAGYCGPISLKGKTDLFVNLRCMKILPDKLALFVGGGLTAKSDPVKEWEETQLKAITLLSVI